MREFTLVETEDFVEVHPGSMDRQDILNVLYAGGFCRLVHAEMFERVMILVVGDRVITSEDFNQIPEGFSVSIPKSDVCIRLIMLSRDDGGTYHQVNVKYWNPGEFTANDFYESMWSAEAL
jgi:hypothetical protein